MIKLIVYSLASFGFAYIVGHSKASLPFRLAIEPEKPTEAAPAIELFFSALRHFVLGLIECPACLGTWTGFLCGVWCAPDFGLGIHGRWITAAVLALYTCGSNFLLARAGGLMEGG